MKNNIGINIILIRIVFPFVISIGLFGMIYIMPIEQEVQQIIESIEEVEGFTVDPIK